MPDKNKIEPYKKSVDTAQKSITSNVCNSGTSHYWPPHTGIILRLKALVAEVCFSSPSPVLSHMNCECYNLLPSASLDGSKISATDGEVSSSEDENKLESASTVLISSVFSLLSRSLICTEPSQPVLRRKLKSGETQKAQPAPQKTQPTLQKAQPLPRKTQPGLKEAPKENVATGDVSYPLPSDPPNKRSLLSSLCIPLLPSEEPNSMKDLDTDHAQLPVTNKHLQTLKTPVSIVYMDLVRILIKTVLIVFLTNIAV